MKVSFNKFALLIALVAAFKDYSFSLGIIIATVALHLIKLARDQFEYKINNAEQFGSKMVLTHLFIVMIIMVITLAISFVWQSYFNPIAVALTFVLQRVFMYFSNYFKREEPHNV